MGGKSRNVDEKTFKSFSNQDQVELAAIVATLLHAYRNYLQDRDELPNDPTNCK